MGFPRMTAIRQKLEQRPLEDPARRLNAELDARGVAGDFRPGDSVAIAVGSRRMDGQPLVLAGLVDRLKAMGCRPFILPAMGSHGGGTPEGERELLRGLGITEERLGAPIRPSSDAVRIGATRDEVPVFTLRDALEADGVVVVNRVAPHTGYGGPVQSGLLKMLAVGLGGRQGARAIHSRGFDARHLIEEAAEIVMQSAPVVLGVALVEDGAKRLSELEVVRAEQIARVDRELLRLAISMYPSIPCSRADVLIVEEMGKDISGSGMDPLVTGRGKGRVTKGEQRFRAERLVVLRLTPGSRGNATGIGHADITTRRLVESIDFESTYRNVMTSGALHRARIPVTAGSEREAIRAALDSLGGVTDDEARVVRIRNTRELERLEVSAPLLVELEGREGMEFGEEREMEFDEHGDLL